MRSRRAPAEFGVIVLAGVVLVQGVHELEHIIQIIQRYHLGIANGNGLIGSIADIEPVHFAYNTLYLFLLIWASKLLGLFTRPTRHGFATSALIATAIAAQTWHEIEHVVKIIQYVTLGVDATGGVFGIGPGGLSPLVRVPVLHLAYNTIAYVPTVAALLLVARRATRRRPSPTTDLTIGPGPVAQT